MENSLPLLQLDQLSLSFESKNGLSPLLNAVSLDVFSGKTLALVGESGSGKSMTALAVMQLLPSNARVHRDSRILFKQHDLLTVSQKAMRKIQGRQIGIVFQNAMSAFNPVLTIGYQLHEVLRCHFRLSHAMERERILALLDEVGIVNPRQCYASYLHELSGGMRQRALIAMALAAEPELLIADEPTTALDVTVQKQVLTMLRTLQVKRRMGMLFISHDLGVVAHIADTVAVLYRGEVVEQADAKDFFQCPKQSYSRQLLTSLDFFRNPTFEGSGFAGPALESSCTDVCTKVPRSDSSSHSSLKASVESSFLLNMKDGSLKIVNNKVPLLKVKDLSVCFSRKKSFKAIANVNFNLSRGKTLALIGESGSGKTTTGKAILQLLSNISGEIYFEGRLLNNLSRFDLKRLRKDIQVIFQDPYSALNPRMTIADILEEGMLIQGIGKTRLTRLCRMDDLLVAVGLNPEDKQRYPHEFSGGQRQRICIARALTVDPKLLICDEPTSALDASVQAQILKLLRQLQQERELAYLLITHNFGVVSYLADDVAVMYRGQIVEYGPSQQILSFPQHPYTQQLLDSVLTV